MSDIAYWCLACPETFPTSEAANRHHENTGHFQTHRKPPVTVWPLKPVVEAHETTKTDWHRRWLDTAAHFGSWSKDPSTKVGAVLVRQGQIVSSGYNGFPRGVADSEERLNDKATKYQWTVHAEMNCLLQAALHGHSTKGCALYTTFPPCSRCAGPIIQAGITVVFFPASVMTHDGWTQEFDTAKEMLDEAGIPIIPV